MSKKERKPSEIIEDFLNLIVSAQKAYQENEKAYKVLDDKKHEWEHKFEFAPNKAERNKLGTAFQRERKERRKLKDQAQLYEIVYNFAKSENNKGCLKRLEGAARAQIKREQYLAGERVYGGSGDG